MVHVPSANRTKPQIWKYNTINIVTRHRQFKDFQSRQMTLLVRCAHGVQIGTRLNPLTKCILKHFQLYVDCWGNSVATIIACWIRSRCNNLVAPPLTLNYLWDWFELTEIKTLAWITSHRAQYNLGASLMWSVRGNYLWNKLFKLLVWGLKWPVRGSTRSVIHTTSLYYDPNLALNTQSPHH